MTNRDKIIGILKNHSIRTNNKASREAGSPRYVVYSEGWPMSDPKPYAQARQELRETIADEIIMATGV